MKEKLTFFFFIFLMIIALKVLSAQNWTNNGPFGSSITVMAINPLYTNIVYAGTKGAGIYRSTSGGNEWELINTGIPMREDSSFHSPTEPSWWFGNYFKVSALLVSPFHPAHLYAGTYGIGLFQSVDHGNNWTSTNTGLPDSAHISVLWMHPQDSTFLLCGTAYPTGVLFKSTVGGYSWTLIDSVPHGSTYGVSTIRHHPGHPDTIYVGITSAGEPGFPWGLMRTTDRGENWQIVNQDFSFYDFQIDPLDPQKLWSVGHTGYFDYVLAHSNDGGSTWVFYPNNNNPWLNVLSLYAEPVLASIWHR